MKGISRWADPLRTEIVVGHTVFPHVEKKSGNIDTYTQQSQYKFVYHT